MKVLVTGLNGFTGRYVQHELECAGHDVFDLNCNLLDVPAVNARVRNIQPDAVIHLAAIAFVAHGDIQQVYNVNIVGSRNLLAALAEFCPNISSVVLASSANIYGNQAGLLNELTKPAPVNDYAVSKLSMECMARIWMERLPLIIARPFNYTGVGQSLNFLIPKIVSHFRERKKIIELGNVDVARDFSDVRDVACAYRLLLEGAHRREVYNIASGNSVELGEILSICSSLLGWDIEVKLNLNFVRDNEIKLLVGDKSKIVHDINYRAKYSIKETLCWMLE